MLRSMCFLVLGWLRYLRQLVSVQGVGAVLGSPVQGEVAVNFGE